MKRIFIFVALVAAVANPAMSQTNQSKAVTTDNDAIAVVLGKTISLKDKDKLNGLIFGTLLEQYAEENKIEPTEPEIDTFVQKTEEMRRQQHVKFEKDREKLVAELKSTSFTEKERIEKTTRLQTLENILKSTNEAEDRTKGIEDKMRTMKRNMALHFVKTWKINKSLYEKYGGRIIFQQAGPEPLDAYREFLKEQEKKGAFQIFNKEYEAAFWKYFVNDAMHTFYSKDEGAKLMKTPWWLLDKPIGE